MLLLSRQRATYTHTYIHTSCIVECPFHGLQAALMGEKTEHVYLLGLELHTLGDFLLDCGFHSFQEMHVKCQSVLLRQIMCQAEGVRNDTLDDTYVRALYDVYHYLSFHFSE